MIAYVVLFRSYTILGRLVQFSMWLYCILRGLKVEKFYNHCEIEYLDLCSGAIETGVKTRYFREVINKEYKGKVEYIKYPIYLDKYEWIKAKIYLDKAENTPYEYSNFWFNIVKIFTGKWNGNRNRKKLYCVEHAINFLNATGRYRLEQYLNTYEAKKLFDEILK